MSPKPNTHLFFIVSPKYNFTAIENFLRKRNFDVVIETDIKTGLMRAMELNPEYIFIALDHPNPKVSVLPQILQQCVPSQIIPFIHSAGKHDVKTLEESNLIHKIFPPMSGPAIERLTVKLRTPRPASDVSVKDKKHADRVLNEFLQQLTERPVATPSVSADSALYLKEKNEHFAKAQATAMNAEQRAKLDHEFSNRFRHELGDVLETHSATEGADVIRLHRERHVIYCLLVQSRSWSGHLMAYSNVSLETHLLEPVFKNWVNAVFESFGHPDSHVFFEIELDLKDFKVWAENKSEYSEQVKIHNSELTMHFVGIEPGRLLVEFDEKNDLLDVDLDIVPLTQDLSLSLFLHLPENQKYLLYTPENQQMSLTQKKRLQENRVEKLFSPVQFEAEVKKLKMKKYLNGVVENLKSDTGE